MMGKRCQIKLFVVLDEKRRVSPRNGIISEGERTRSSWPQDGVILADFWGFWIFSKGPPTVP